MTVPEDSVVGLSKKSEIETSAQRLWTDLSFGKTVGTIKRSQIQILGRSTLRYTCFLCKEPFYKQH